MAESVNPVIHQTLHGYADGHTLLASSCDLTPVEKKALLLLSDLSGQTGNRNFDSYLTGYPLPGKRYYALARTWYAPEMPRPGCVWTQTLLLALPLLTRISNLSELNNLFVRPLIGQTTPYLSAIPVDEFTDIYKFISASLYGVRPSFYAIAYHLYSKTKEAIVVPAESAAEYEDDILSIWSQQWPRLRRSFSFCTGSLSIRELDSKPLDFQVVPDSYGSRLSRQQTDNIAVADLSAKNKVTNWFKVYEGIEPQRLQSFMYHYGSDIIGKRSKFAPLCLAYGILDNKPEPSITFESILLFLKQNFSSASEAKRLKRDLINRLIDYTPDGKYAFVEAFLTSPNADLIPTQEWDLSELIIQLWSEDKISSDKITRLLEKLDSSRLSEAQKLQLLNGLPVEAWIDIEWVSHSLLTEVVIAQPQLIIRLWSEGKIDKKQLITLLEELSEATDAQKLKLLSNLPIELWADVRWVTDALIRQIVTTQPHVLEQPIFWQGPIPSQLIGLKVFTKNSGDFFHVGRVVAAMINAHNDRWIENLSSELNYLILFAALDWLIHKPNATLPQKWENLVWAYPSEYLEWLVSNQHYTERNTELMLQILVAKNFNADSLSKEDVNPLLTRLVKLRASSMRNKAMAIWLAKGLNNLHPAAKEITIILFQPIYNILKQDQLDYDSWLFLNPGFEKPIESFSFYEIPKIIIKFFSEEKPQSDDWDKCGQLRQKIIQSCILLQWPSEVLCRAITDKITFEDITKYALKLESGRVLFTRVLRFIKENKKYKNPGYEKIIEFEFQRIKKGKKKRK
ncbi:GAP1-N1 domain-containing protein [Hymenobacter rubidus]|uniref:GAP1-N1 domain-containing protein n=1 Tax=Hymenobacter rubidus TaxID=1441626 RepID=UPI00191D8CF8|nr:hypothetical protein [Hymenobacter rubidus]